MRDIVCKLLDCMRYQLGLAVNNDEPISNLREALAINPVLVGTGISWLTINRRDNASNNKANSSVSSLSFNVFIITWCIHAFPRASRRISWTFMERSAVIVCSEIHFRGQISEGPEISTPNVRKGAEGAETPGSA